MPPGAKFMAAEVEGGVGLASPLRTIGGIGGSGVANGAPVSQSHSERLRGLRARPSHEGGALDQIAQPPSCHAITQIINSRCHILCAPSCPGSLEAAISRTLAYAVTLNAPQRQTCFGLQKTESVIILTCLFRQGAWEALTGLNSRPIAPLASGIDDGVSLRKASDFVVTGSSAHDAVNLFDLVFGAIGRTSDSKALVVVEVRLPRRAEACLLVGYVGPPRSFSRLRRMLLPFAAKEDRPDEDDYARFRSRRDGDPRTQARGGSL